MFEILVEEIKESAKGNTSIKLHQFELVTKIFKWTWHFGYFWSQNFIIYLPGPSYCPYLSSHLSQTTLEMVQIIASWELKSIQ